MKVLVCGGRDYTDWETVKLVLNGLDGERYITEVISGGAKGADRLAETWALDNKKKSTVINADWDKHGKRAGYLRNLAMADLGPDLVFAFPGGVGTKMMIDIAKRRGIEVQEYYKGLYT